MIRVPGWVTLAIPMVLPPGVAVMGVRKVLLEGLPDAARVEVLLWQGMG
jgi:hypothetical protein